MIVGFTESVTVILRIEILRLTMSRGERRWYHAGKSLRPIEG